MSLLFTDNARSALLGAITTQAVTIFCAALDAELFPQPVLASDSFMLTLENMAASPPQREIVRVTSRVGNQMTVLRAQEGTRALAWPTGTVLSHRLTAGSLTEIAAGVPTTAPLYLGAFATPPASLPSGGNLIYGNLYFDTAQNKLFQWSGLAWVAIVTAASTTGGVYLGAFAVAPQFMSDNITPVLAGTLYYDTVQDQLFTFVSGAWTPSNGQLTASLASVITGDQSVSGNVHIGGNEIVDGNGTFSNIIVNNDTATKTLHLNGNLVVDQGDVSGGRNNQNFPTGMQFQWGSGVTQGSGVVSVTFPIPFDGAITPTVMATPGGSTGSAAGADGGYVIPTNVTADGFTAKTYGGLSGEPYGPIGFQWLAIGLMPAS